MRRTSFGNLFQDTHAVGQVNECLVVAFPSQKEKRTIERVIYSFDDYIIAASVANFRLSCYLIITNGIPSSDDIAFMTGGGPFIAYQALVNSLLSPLHFEWTFFWTGNNTAPGAPGSGSNRVQSDVFIDIPAGEERAVILSPVFKINTVSGLMGPSEQSQRSLTVLGDYDTGTQQAIKGHWR